LVLAQISEKDIGTAFEIGYARALGKDIVLVGFDEKDFERKTNLMLAFAADQCITIDKMYKIFNDTIDYSTDTVNTDMFDEWRNIE
jgi:nucleoside 2-deoxyribosyltransferase